MQNCVLGSPPWEKNNGRHKNPFTGFFVGFRNRKVSAGRGWLE
jgi:hypothetical protein